MSLDNILSTCSVCEYIQLNKGGEWYDLKAQTIHIQDFYKDYARSHGLCYNCYAVQLLELGLDEEDIIYRILKAK